MKKNRIRRYLICFALFFSCFSLDVIAADFSPYLSLGSELLYGNNKSTDESSAKSRSLYVLGVDSALGVRWKSFIFGGGIGYSLWKQITNPSTIDNSNTQGKMLGAGPVIGYNFGIVSLLGRYNIFSKYTTDQKTIITDQSIEYSSPQSSFVFDLQLNTGLSTHWGIRYSHVQYKEYSLGGQASKEMKSGNELNFTALGLTYGWVY